MSINDLTAELVSLAGSQHKAADISGVSQANISKLASGEIGQGVRADTERKIKKALAKMRRAKKKEMQV